MKLMITFVATLVFPMITNAQEAKYETTIMEQTTSYHWNEASQPMIKDGNFSIVNTIKTAYLGVTVTRQGEECFRTVTKLKGTTNLQINFFFPNGDSRKVNQILPSIEKTRSTVPCTLA